MAGGLFYSDAGLSVSVDFAACISELACLPLFVLRRKKNDFFCVCVRIYLLFVFISTLFKVYTFIFGFNKIDKLYYSDSTKLLSALYIITSRESSMSYT